LKSLAKMPIDPNFPQVIFRQSFRFLRQWQMSSKVWYGSTFFSAHIWWNVWWN